MPRPVGYGRPGTAVFPAAWGVTNGRVIGDTLDSTITISRPGGTPSWNATSGRTETQAASPIYQGPASLIPDTDATREIAVAEDPVPVRVYEIKLEHATVGVKAGMKVLVNTSPDPMLVAQSLTVTGVEYDTRRFSRVLTATLNQTR